MQAVCVFFFKHRLHLQAVSGVNNIKFHPVTAILYTLILFFILLVFDNPVIVAVLTLLTALNLVASGGYRKRKKAIAGSLYTGLLIFFINPLVSRLGMTFLFSLELPLAGKLGITLEAVVFGAVMGCKVIGVTLVFFLYASLIDADDSFSFFSKYAHKLTLTFSMTLNIMHRLALDIWRIRDVMVLRGADFNGKKPFTKVRAYYPLLKVVLISALEGSLERAEALYSKGYGKYKRTSYSRLSLGSLDYAFLFLCLAAAVIFIAGRLQKLGGYSFYPGLEALRPGDAFFCLFQMMPAVAGAFIMWRSNQWKYSKSRT